MNAIVKVLILILMAQVLAACQRVIDVEVANSAPQLVIEGNLTDHTGTQTVTLTTSIPYANSNVFPPVTGALVKIVDGFGNVYQLVEKTPGIYTINSFKGKPQNLYQLTVNTGGKNYAALSVMPLAVNLDSLTLSAQVLGNKTIKTVSVNYRDPASAPNQYRFVMYVNGVQVRRIFVDNDTFSDGRLNVSTLYQDDIEVKSGDTIDVDMECIDANIYNYWYSLSSQGGNTPVDSSTPANPPSNFDNHALGYFSAHTVQRKTIKVP